MKLNVKSLMLLMSAGIVFSLTGCDGGSSTTTTTDPDPAPGELGYQVTNPDGSITYVDYTEGNRTAPASAAAAEYHTGVGYGETLFDSADNKCMNCHNELYDTWKGSMHGKSWTDPIFQSKFQDFLRTHLAKIGETKAIEYQQASVGVGTKNMFSGAAQTCIKCHAPGAYYAGDVNVTVSILQDAADLNSTEWADLKSANEVNDPNGQTVVIAANKQQNKIYKATFQIGHEANREGINCAFCHSIETPRLMRMFDANGTEARDGGLYDLVKDMRVGPHGPVKQDEAIPLAYSDDATDPDMNKFFRLWGPEKYKAYHATPKGVNGYHDAGEFDINKSADGRYTMTSKNIHDENNTHYTGGPFYGPFGVSGKSNENADDTTDRKALINPHFDKDLNNHFGESGKGLCLSCHQRSAGAWDPVAGEFMELCSTQMAVTTGSDTAAEESLSSPKCQKCHMERIEGDLLHQWARPDLDFEAETFKAAVGYDLTPELDNEVSTDVIPAGEAPERDGWFNSHAFLGASKTGGHKTSVTAKIQSGFEASLEQVNNGNVLVVSTSFANKTAHMFPGAHPMRRVLTRVIVTDENGDKIEFDEAYGQSSFDDIENNVQPVAGKTLHSSAFNPVSVVENQSADLNFTGKAPDLNGEVSSQKFDGTTVTLTAVDGTVKNQVVSASGVTTGTNKNAAIVDSGDNSTFTRIYGHETGKMYDLDGNTSTPKVFVVRPGFDSNTVENDNRLSPNETETYLLVYDISGKTGVKVDYKVYYMQKGAGGAFPATEDGWLDGAVNTAKKILITEVGSYSEAL